MLLIVVKLIRLIDVSLFRFGGKLYKVAIEEKNLYAVKNFVFYEIFFKKAHLLGFQWHLHYIIHYLPTVIN